MQSSTRLLKFSALARNELQSVGRENILCPYIIEAGKAAPHMQQAADILSVFGYVLAAVPKEPNGPPLIAYNALKLSC